MFKLILVFGTVISSIPLIIRIIKRVSLCPVTNGEKIDALNSKKRQLIFFISLPILYFVTIYFLQMEYGFVKEISLWDVFGYSKECFVEIFANFFMLVLIVFLFICFPLTYIKL